jgi:hypothetical protein
MAPVSIGIVTLFGGYSVTYYALSQLLGGNWGIMDLIMPGRWTKETAAKKRDGAK